MNTNETDTVSNPLQPIAEQLAARTADLKEAGVAVDLAATPFSRSMLASLRVGVSIATVETIIVASYGSPKSPSTGKRVKGVSGLRNVEGGAAAYQTFKTVSRIADAMNDPSLFEGEGDNNGKALADIIRPIVDAFAMNTKEAPRSLHALSRAVADVLSAHAKAVAAKAGVTETDDKGDNDNIAPPSLTEQAVALTAAIAALSDEEYMAHSGAFAPLSDLIITRWEAIEAATQDATPAVAA